MGDCAAPFIGSVDDQMNPRESTQQGVITFDAIRDGGQFRVVYVPGSTQEDSPDQKIQKISVLRQMGLFGDPADPETNALVVRMLQLPETGTILQHLANQQMKQQEQQQMMMEMQQQQMEMQAMPKQAAFDPEAEQLKSELRIREADAKADAASRSKQDDYAAQKLTDLQAGLMQNAINPNQQQQAKPQA